MADLRQSERVRGIVKEKYVSPAVAAGEKRLSIRVRDVLKEVEATPGFPRGRTPLICNVLTSQKLLREAGLEIEGVDGPPSRQSRTVVVHYRVVATATAARPEVEAGVETSAEWAARLTGKLRGLLKEELGAYGGAEAFMKWVRSDEANPE